MDCKCLLFFHIFIIVLEHNIYVCQYDLEYIKFFKDSAYQNYAQYKEYRPLLNQTNPILIHLMFFPLSIHSFDEVTGSLRINSHILVLWNNEILLWPEEIMTTMTFEANRVWFPEVYISNPTESSKYAIIDYNKLQVVATCNGTQLLFIPGFSSTACVPDISNFPFDEHVCPLDFFVPKYGFNELEFQSLSFFMDMFVKPSSWTLKKIEIDPSIDKVRQFSIAKFRITIKRKYEYFLANVLAPVMTLCILNSMVFLLPVESGERVGFSITMFLSFAVYLSFISDKLPASQPLPKITYFLVGTLVFSLCIVACNILSLWFFFNDGKIPVSNKIKLIMIYKLKLRSFLKPCQRITKSKRNQVNLSSVSISCEQNDSNKNENIASEISNIMQNKENHNEVNWVDVSKLFDKLCFVLGLMTIIVSVIFVIIIANE